MTTPSDLIEEVAKAIEDAEIGYSLNLTRLVDNESTYVLTYTDGSEPLEFSDTDAAYEHIANKRATSRAKAAASVIIEACAKEAETASAFYAHGDGELWIANKIAEDIRALAAKPEGA